MNTREDLQKIHSATLEVLSEVGVHVGCKYALNTFEKGGCHVDRETMTARIPGDIIEEAVKSSPSGFTLYGKTSDFDICLADGKVYHSPFGAAPQFEDPVTGEVRDPKKEDLANCAAVIDALDEYNFCFSTMTARDVDSNYCNIHSFEAHYTRCRKPILASCSRKWTVEYDIEMAAMERGGLDKLREKPPIMFGCCTISPLVIPVEACEVLMTAAENNIPVANMTMSTCGGQAPVTLAGSAIIANAENLAALVLTQLVRKGARYVCGGSPGISDMRHAAAAVVGCPEAGLLS